MEHTFGCLLVRFAAFCGPHVRSYVCSCLGLRVMVYRLLHMVYSIRCGFFPHIARRFSRSTSRVVGFPTRLAASRFTLDRFCRADARMVTLIAPFLRGWLSCGSYTTPLPFLSHFLSYSTHGCFAPCLFAFTLFPLAVIYYFTHGLRTVSRAHRATHQFCRCAMVCLSTVLYWFFARSVCISVHATRTSGIFIWLDLTDYRDLHTHYTPRVRAFHTWHLCWFLRSLWFSAISFYAFDFAFFARLHLFVNTLAFSGRSRGLLSHAPHSSASFAVWTLLVYTSHGLLAYARTASVLRSPFITDLFIILHLRVHGVVWFASHSHAYIRSASFLSLHHTAGSHIPLVYTAILPRWFVLSFIVRATGLRFLMVPISLWFACLHCGGLRLPHGWIAVCGLSRCFHVHSRHGSPLLRFAHVLPRTVPVCYSSLPRRLHLPSFYLHVRSNFTVAFYLPRLVRVARLVVALVHFPLRSPHSRVHAHFSRMYTFTHASHTRVLAHHAPYAGSWLPGAHTSLPVRYTTVYTPTSHGYTFTVYLYVIAAHGWLRFSLRVLFLRFARTRHARLYVHTHTLSRLVLVGSVPFHTAACRGSLVTCTHT